MNHIAPIGQIYVCGACGKRSHDRYGTQPIDSGWDESCYMYSTLCNENDLIIENGRVIKVRNALDELFNQNSLIEDKLENNIRIEMKEDQILDDYCLEMDLPIPSGEARSLMMILVKSILSRRPEIETGKQFIAYCEDWSRYRDDDDDDSRHWHEPKIKE